MLRVNVLDSQTKSFLILGPAGDIEVAVTTPLNVNHQIAIICHPHPLYKGSMNNKVVTTVARTLSEVNYIAIRFNFRGVGKSVGIYDNTKGEIEDLLAVIQWAKEVYGVGNLVLAGFSFGAFIAAKVATQISITQLILIAPPVNHFNFMDLSFSCPVLIIQGDQDEVVPAEKVLAWARQLSPPAEVMQFSKTSHFFHGKLTELQTALKVALREPETP